MRSNLAVVVQDSIYQYFFTSDRNVKTLKIGTYKKLSTSGLDYLVEADVVAQSPVNDEYISYHCGVFIGKIRNRWENQQTVCEALPGISFGIFFRELFFN